MFPTSRLWVEDLVKDVARTAKLRYQLKTNKFFVVLFEAPAQSYGQGDIRAAFNVEIHNWCKPSEDVEIKYATFAGDDSKIANFEWNYGMDPMKMPKAPSLAPKSPDPAKTSMFPGGIAHHQYPKVSRLSYARRQATHHYAKIPTKYYGKIETRRIGLPSVLPSFSSIRKPRMIGSRKARRDDVSY